MADVPKAALDNPLAFVDELCRRDFASFLRGAFEQVMGGEALVWNWHLEAIAFELMQVEQGNNLRLLVTLPPRNLKSFAITVAWVAWMLGRDPTLKFVCVSYSGELASKHARQCRALMQSAWYRRIFPQTIISKSRSATDDFETTRGGERFATSITGTFTGRGGKIIIIDDPIKPDEAMSDTTRDKVNHWYRTTLSSRLDDKVNGALICVMQRLHAFDLAGLMLEDGGWKHLNLPAIAVKDEIIPLTRGRFHERKEGDVLHPDRENRAVFDSLKAQMGSAVFSAQYQQDPVPPGGNMVQQDWLNTYHNLPDIEAGDLIVQSWDTASKDGLDNDWSVCITALVKHKKVYIVDIYRRRLKFPNLMRAAIAQARDQNADVLLIEDAATGASLIQSLRNKEPVGVPLPIRQKPDSDKKTRFAGVTHMIEAGQLYLPADAGWLAEFMNELLGFPNAKFDDQVDSLAYLLRWVDRSSRDYDNIIALPEIPDEYDPDELTQEQLIELGMMDEGDVWY